MCSLQRWEGFVKRFSFSQQWVLKIVSLTEILLISKGAPGEEVPRWTRDVNKQEETPSRCPVRSRTNSDLQGNTPAKLCLHLWAKGGSSILTAWSNRVPDDDFAHIALEVYFSVLTLSLFPGQLNALETLQGCSIWKFSWGLEYWKPVFPWRGPVWSGPWLTETKGFRIICAWLQAAVLWLFSNSFVLFHAFPWSLLGLPSPSSSFLLAQASRSE